MLAKNEFRNTINKEFPNWADKIKKVDINDARLNAALFRDYSILSAAYLLEPCHQSFVKTKNYGIGSDHLPEQLAMPLKFLSDRVRNGNPLLDYAYGYGLNNWMFTEDPTPGTIHYKNEMVLPSRSRGLKEHIKPIRKFNGCTDEHGFIVVHCAINALTHDLIKSFDTMYEGARAKDRSAVN